MIARADDFADALAGTPFAVHVGGPLLITGKAELDVRVSAKRSGECSRRPGRCICSAARMRSRSVVVDGITSLGFNPVRIAGVDRFDTAMQIAAQFGAPVKVMLCSGLSFPDALSAGAAAAASGGFVLLTNGSSLPSPVAQYLLDHPGAQYFAIGGPAAQAAPTAIAIVGVDRFDTAVQVAAEPLQRARSSSGRQAVTRFPTGSPGER